MSLSICWVKNTSGSDAIWRGQLIADGAYYQIQDSERSEWQSDDSVISSIAAGDLVVAADNSGTNDIAGVSAQVSYLKSIDMTPRDTDGAALMRSKTTKTGWHYEPRSLDFFTSTAGSLYNRKDDGAGMEDGTDYGDGTIKFYDGSGNELSFQQTGHESETSEQFQTRLDTDCIKTIVDWYATYDFDIIGGTLEIVQPPAYPSRAYIWTVVAPDIPAFLGGSVPYFAGGLPLHFYVNTNRLTFDGRGVKTFTYDPVYASNKIRFTIKHEAGAQIGVNIVLDHFKA